MPLIQKPQQLPAQEQVRYKLNKSVIDAIDKYCTWAEITPDYFIEQAVQFLLEKDKEWKVFNKSLNHKGKSKKKAD